MEKRYILNKDGLIEDIITGEITNEKREVLNLLNRQDLRIDELERILIQNSLSTTRINSFYDKRFKNISSIPGTYVIADLETGERLSSIEILIDKLNAYEDQIKPIRDVCDKYDINLNDLPSVLEEYISYDNAEYLEKLEKGR